MNKSKCTHNYVTLMARCCTQYLSNGSKEKHLLTHHFNQIKRSAETHIGTMLKRPKSLQIIFQMYLSISSDNESGILMIF